MKTGRNKPKKDENRKEVQGRRQEEENTKERGEHGSKEGRNIKQPSVRDRDKMEEIS